MTSLKDADEERRKDNDYVNLKVQLAKRDWLSGLFAILAGVVGIGAILLALYVLIRFVKWAWT